MISKKIDDYLAVFFVLISAPVAIFAYVYGESVLSWGEERYLITIVWIFCYILNTAGAHIRFNN